MNSTSLIVQSYLSSLKEDTELDHLFPMLLNVMGYRIVQTAKESKGQSQYGKDIIAIGEDENGVKHRWYFELKGYSDKDITDKNYSKTDGIRESIIEAKDTVFNDSTIPLFNKLPIKIVLVHNGILKANIRPTFEGLISREFEDGQFERWDIYHLTNLFSEHLFGEYLLSDEKSNRLMKRALVFLDTPGNDYSDFEELVSLQFEKVSEIKGRAFKKLFATLNLLNSLVYSYSIENNYLTPAKECSKFLVLKTWNWILKKNIGNKKAVNVQFLKILKGQYETLNRYFSRTFKIARIPDGLYAENGVFYEILGYPIRCFEYIDDLVYFYRLRNFLYPSKDKEKLINKQKDSIIELIKNNSGFYRPVYDNHSIPIVQLFLFFANEGQLRQIDIEFLYSYIFQIVEGLNLQKIKRGFLPDIGNNVELTIEAFATGNKPEGYSDASSILLAILLELSVVFNSDILFKKTLSLIDPKVSLQIASIEFDGVFKEEWLFERNLNDVYFVECIERIEGSLKLLVDDQDFEKFKKRFKNMSLKQPEFLTDELGYSFVRFLSHSYYKNEIFPFEWRNLIDKNKTSANNT